MLRQKITRKLTLILFALLVVLIGSAITMQFLFVSRFHTTTDYTRRRMETIQERTPLLHQRGLSGFHKKDREKIDRLLTAFGKENSASCLLLDNNGVVLGQFNFENQLSGQFVSYAQKLLLSGQIYDDTEKPFRIQIQSSYRKKILLCIHGYIVKNRRMQGIPGGADTACRFVEGIIDKSLIFHFLSLI